MAKFNIQYADQPVRVQSTAAYARPQTSAFEALARAGNAIYQIGQQEKEKLQLQQQREEELKSYTEIENGKIAISEHDAETASMLLGLNDPNEIQQLSETRLKQRSDLYKDFATTPESELKLNLHTRKTAVSQAANINQIRFSKQQEQAFLAYDATYTKLSDEGAFDAMTNVSLNAYKAGIIDQTEYSQRLNKIPQLQHDWNVEQIRTATQSMIGDDGNKTEAYKVIDQAQKEGLITAEDNKMLGDSLDNFVAGRFHQENKARYTAKIETYGDFVGKMQEGTLTYEDIGNSTLSTDDKASWGTFIQNQYTPAPVRSEFDGFNAAADIVFRANMLQIGPAEAYEQLMTERYVNGSLTDKDFQWAVEKIQKPYDRDVVGDIQTVFTDNNEKQHGRWFSKADKQKAQQANEFLLAWVDKKIEEGSPPNTAEMLAKSKWFRAGAKPTAYDIGDTIQKGGQSWTVVGFDVDNTPLVEEE